ncbi:MAG: hypothetical protein GX637_04815 [Clostridiales bacterium]|nr:hypothetical protein [Clostridiales bacterium]
MKYLRRLIWYVSTRLMVLVAVLGLITMAFYFSMNATNIYVILKDGMAKRAQTVMMGAEEELSKYFAPAYLQRDPLLLQAQRGESPYQNCYTITGFDHRINIDWVWCWPWEDTARATVTERIPAIDGRMKPSAREEVNALGWSSTPKWQNAQYSVVLSRENGQWRVKNLTLIKSLDE